MDEPLISEGREFENRMHIDGHQGLTEEEGEAATQPLAQSTGEEELSGDADPQGHHEGEGVRTETHEAAIVEELLEDDDTDRLFGSDEQFMNSREPGAQPDGRHRIERESLLTLFWRARWRLTVACGEMFFCLGTIGLLALLFTLHMRFVGKNGCLPDPVPGRRPDFLEVCSPLCPPK